MRQPIISRLRPIPQMDKVVQDPNRLVSKPKKKLDELKASLGDGLSPEERAYFEKLESTMANKVDYNDPAEVEADIRRREIERINRTYSPRAPLYKTPGKTPHVTDSDAKRRADANPEKKSYQHDPRYREYYERLKKSRPETQNTPYDEDVKPMTLDELEQQGWDGSVTKPRPQAPRPAAPVPGPRTAGATTVSERPGHMPPKPATRNPDIGAGAIMRLDDGSVAIYKDAVSGKDYALFYFLEPDGTVAPRGIFVQQYDAQRIGHLPDILFQQLIQSGTWDRDAVIFHLDKYEFATHVRQVAAHQEGRTPGASRDTDIHTAAGDSQSMADDVPIPAPAKDPLERGRILRINVGGKVWESVFWTRDAMGPIVAHDTNKEWALMHLDLSRFKDSIEYGEVLTGSRLKDIERSLARA